MGETVSPAPTSAVARASPESATDPKSAVTKIEPRKSGVVSIAATTSVPSSARTSVRFLDEERRQVMLELDRAGSVHYYVNGRHKVNKVSHIHAVGRTLHVEGTRLLSCSCTAVIPEGQRNGKAPEEVIVSVMELFAQRNPCGRSARRLTVWMTSARGLRNADGLPGQGSSDPYCICEVVGRPGTKQATAFIKNTCNPEWAHVCEIDEWLPGDSLLFTLWDKDWFSRDDLLGRAELSLGKGDLPSFEGELQLQKAGKGVEAFLTVRVLAGSRYERAVRRLRSDLRRAGPEEAEDGERLQHMLREARALGLPDQDQASAQSLLGALDLLCRTCAEGEAESLRAAVEAASALGLAAHHDCRRARQLLGLLELNAACRDHQGIGALQAALSAAREAGAEEVDLVDGEELLKSLLPLKRVRRQESAELAAAVVKEASVLGLEAWPEFVEAQEHAESLAISQLADVCRSPGIDRLEQALQVARDAQVSEDKFAKGQELLDVLRGLVSTLEAFDEAHSQQRRTHAASFVSSASPRRDRATTNFSRISGGGYVPGAAQSSSAADTSASSQPLRAAISRARALDVAEGGCHEFAAAAGRLREVALASLASAHSRAELRAAVDLGREACLEKVELAEAEHVLQVKDDLEQACIKRKEEALRTAVVAADMVKFSKASCAEYQKAKLMLVAHERLRDARIEGKESMLLAAIEAAKAAGLGQAELAAAGDTLASLKLEHTVRDKLGKAVQSGKRELIEQALASADFVGLQCCDEYMIGKRLLTMLMAGDAVRAALDDQPISVKELSQALVECTKLGLEDRTRKVPKEIVQTIETGKTKLSNLIAEKRRLDDICNSASRSEISMALKSAKAAGLGGKDTKHAEELLLALHRLAAVAERGSIEELRDVVVELKGGEFEGTEDFKACQDRLKVEEARLAVVDAAKSGKLDAIRTALDRARLAKLPERELADLDGLLQELEAEQEHHFNGVRQRLRAASQSATSLAPLEEALRAAEEVSLPETDVDLLRARDLFWNRKEALKMLDHAVSEKELVKALDRASGLGMASYPEFLDAKKVLDQRRELSKRSQHLDQARRDLEKAIAKGKKEALERAIRQAKVLDMDPTEHLLKRAQLKLKEIMADHISRLVKKVDLALREGTLDKTRLDHMTEAKEELVSSIKIAKSLRLAEVDLRELERLRKVVHNVVEDLKGSVRVFCRVRPLSNKERAVGDVDLVKQLDPMTIEVSELTKSVEGRNRRDAHKFLFDAVFTPGSQETIFADCKELVQSALDGYNVTIFAYGQTGAGKTYTMTGDPQAEGIAPLTADAIYSIMHAHKEKVRYDVKASIVELYCNQFHDLLSSKAVVKKGGDSIEVKFDKETQAVVVEGLTEEDCGSAQDLRTLLMQGQESRKVAQTAMNHESSRSHLLMIVKIGCMSIETGERWSGKIVLVDLAGSERLKKSKPSPQQQAEAIEINKSLTALVDVIEALVQSQKDKKEGKPPRFIPYRNHKLTQLLQDTLGGAAKALMLVNCSPASSSAAETLSSLRYASRAKTITNMRHCEDQSAPAETRPLMARLRTVRSLNDLRKFKTFNSDDDLDQDDPSSDRRCRGVQKKRTVRFSTSLDYLEPTRSRSQL